jgi:ABC-2 type transport system ATP-binding protein
MKDSVRPGNNTILKTVMLSKVCSAEHYVDGAELTRVLSDISFDVFTGEAVGISAKNIVEAGILLEIIANVRPYYSGKCVLAEKGMMQEKRVILPHLFYIDTPLMLYNNMTVIEFLSFAAVNSNIPDPRRQQALLDMLIAFGLESIALTDIARLSDTDKIIVELIVASYSTSSLVVLNALSFDFSDSQIRSIKKICDVIQERGSIVIGTQQAKLIGMCCDKVAFIVNGTLRFFGSVSDLCKSWDKVLYLISDSKPEDVVKTLTRACDKYSYVILGNSILVYNYSESPISDADFFEIVFDNGIKPDNIKINKGRVGNSFEELSRMHGI